MPWERIHAASNSTRTKYLAEDGSLRYVLRPSSTLPNIPVQQHLSYRPPIRECIRKPDRVNLPVNSCPLPGQLTDLDPVNGQLWLGLTLPSSSTPSLYRLYRGFNKSLPNQTLHPPFNS